MNKEYIETLDKIVECSTFDSIAPLAMYFHCDNQSKETALKAFHQLQRECQIKEVLLMTSRNIEEHIEPDNLDFVYMYNKHVEQILEEHGLETYIDQNGGYGYIKKNNTKVCSSKSGCYPFYLNESIFRHRLVEWNKSET